MGPDSKLKRYSFRGSRRVGSTGGRFSDCVPSTDALVVTQPDSKPADASASANSVVFFMFFPCCSNEIIPVWTSLRLPHPMLSLMQLGASPRQRPAQQLWRLAPSEIVLPHFFNRGKVDSDPNFR